MQFSFQFKVAAWKIHDEAGQYLCSSSAALSAVEKWLKIFLSLPKSFIKNVNQSKPWSSPKIRLILCATS